MKSNGADPAVGDGERGDNLPPALALVPESMTPLEAEILALLTASGRCPPELLGRNKITLALKLLIQTFLQIDAQRAQAVEDVRLYKAALHAATRG